MKILPQTETEAALLLNRLIKKTLRIATAESCTGGLIGGALTNIAGSSAVFDCGFITYSNKAKMRLLGVPKETLQKHSAVSRETARAMAEGARLNGKVDVSVAVTGISGPGGGTKEKPVGLVCMASSASGVLLDEEHRFGDLGREEVRAETLLAAFSLVHKVLDKI